MQPDDPAWDEELGRPRRPMDGVPTVGRRGGMGNDDTWAGCDSGGSDSGGGPDSGGCDSGGCDSGGCSLMRLSALLAAAALLTPARDGGLVAAVLRLYRRRLTRFTRPCPSTPSCSAYALAAVETCGPRRGLAAAAHRVRACGRPGSGAPTGRVECPAALRHRLR